MPHTITMTEQQLRRYEVITKLIGGTLTAPEAGAQLDLSVRQVKRLKKRVKRRGAKAVLHGNAGKRSGRKTPQTLRTRICRLIKKHYVGFKPTFAMEKLDEVHGITRSREYIRTLMIDQGLWHPRERRGRVDRQWRPRMERVGDMEQFDGSYHDWLSNGTELCLLASIDDATGIVTKAHFGTNEGVVQVMTFWKEYAEAQRKLPKRLYVDKFSTYKVNHKHAVDDPDMVTHFEVALQTLGVELICAHSPQAKGRIERLFGTLQDRLVKELKLAGVTTVTEANRFLRKYLPRFNKKFGVIARQQGDGYASVSEATDLMQVFVELHERRVLRDFTIQFECAWYQIAKEQNVSILPRDRVVMEKRLDGSVACRLARRDSYIRIEKLPVRPERTPARALIPATTRTPYVPPSNHPWRRSHNTARATK